MQLTVKMEMLPVFQVSRVGARVRTGNYRYALSIYLPSHKDSQKVIAGCI